MFVDELTITAIAGNGGDGVVRWRREKFIDRGGPSGGDGGRGGDVYMRAVRNLSLLAKYTGSKEFCAGNAHAGEKKSRHGKDGEDLYIDVPVGSIVHEQERNRTFTFTTEGQVERILKGGRGGFGNEYFKSSINRAPEESTKGKRGERGTFTIELSLTVDAGLIGMPNAGKSTLLNALTNAQARVGAYPFTTIEPHLGDLYGFVIADIPGLIEGAHEGKGLGHKFLKHVTRTKMILHCVSHEHGNPMDAYATIRNELKEFDPELLTREEWILLTKSDLVSQKVADHNVQLFKKSGKSNVFSISAETEDNIKLFQDTLTQHLTSSN